MDNLKLIEQDIDVFIDPNGAPGSILAVNNQAIFKAILEKVGKYTGSPFIAKRNLNLFSPGDFSWNGNAMNNETEFMISISKFTTDLNDVGLILDTLIPNDLIQFKDFNGRSIFLTYFSHTQMTDGNDAFYYDIAVTGFSNNLNYTYQVNESQIAVISFHKKINEFSDAPIDGETYARKDGAWESFDLSQKADLVGGLVPASQLPSYVDDVLEFANLASFPVTGETGKIYLALDTNKTFRWTGSVYIQLSSGIEFPTSDGVFYGVLNGVPTQIVNDLYHSWFSYMANNAGAWLGLNTGNPLTIYGTSAVVPRSGTSIYGSIIMNNCVSALTNGSNAGIKNNNASDGVYREGVDAYFVWANNSASDQQNTCVGLYSLLLVIPNLNPSNFTASTMIVGNDVGDSNLSFFVNRTASVASFQKIDCGSNFPANTTSDAYLLRIQINKTEIEANRIAKMTLINIVTGHIFEHTFSGNQIPDSNANFAVVINRNNRNTGTATDIRPAKIHVSRKLF